MPIGYAVGTKDNIVTESTTNKDLELSALFSNGGEVEIITNMDGVEFTVDYYKQILDVNDTPKAHDTNTPPAIQSYINISDLTLYLDAPLSPTGGDYTTLNGSAKFSTNMIPSIGDLFTSIVQGKLAIFNVTKVSKVTFNNVYIFKIDFIFSYFKDTDSSRYEDLLYKVSTEDMVLQSTGEIISTSTYTNINNLLPLRNKLIDNLFDLIYDPDTNLFLLPTVKHKVVDFNLLNFLSKIIDVNEHFLMLNLNDVTIEAISAKDTIFDMLLDTRNDSRFLNRSIGVIPYKPNTSTLNYTFNAKYYQLDYIIGNLDTTSIPDTIEYKKSVFSGSKLLTERIKDNNYIFNEEFYIATDEAYEIEKLDKVELLVYDFINSKSTNITSLIELMSEVRLWDTYRQVYYTAILIGIATKCLNKYKVI